MYENSRQRLGSQNGHWLNPEPHDRGTSQNEGWLVAPTMDADADRSRPCHVIPACGNVCLQLRCGACAALCSRQHSSVPRRAPGICADRQPGLLAWPACCLRAGADLPSTQQPLRHSPAPVMHEVVSTAQHTHRQCTLTCLIMPHPPPSLSAHRRTTTTITTTATVYGVRLQVCCYMLNKLKTV